MASSGRSAKHSVNSQLRSEPYRFSFVQAVRLLEKMGGLDSGAAPSIGGDALPSQERLRIAGVATRSFAPSEVVSLSDKAGQDAAQAGDAHKAAPPKLTVAFMGLFGPGGVLPHHDTQRIIDNGSKNTAERDFLDVFNHRMLSYFYRASVKYHVPFAYEAQYANQSSAVPENAVTRGLFSMVGLGTDGLRGRLEIPDEFAIEFAGVFSQNPKNPASLARMLESFFGIPVRVIQFVGQWLSLSAENQSEMPTLGSPSGKHCQLGQSFILGERVWDLASKFRLRLGPLDRNQFNSFLPGGENLVLISQMVRLYIGNQLDFDLQLELRADAVPSIQLGENSRLGHDTWVVSKPVEENKADTVFVQSGLPVDSPPPTVV